MSSSDPDSENENFATEVRRDWTQNEFFKGAFDNPFFQNGFMQHRPVEVPAQTVNIGINNANGNFNFFTTTIINESSTLDSGESQKEVEVKTSILESKEVITTNHMYKVAELIGKDWKKMAFNLPSTPKFVDDHLNTIEMGKWENTEEMIRQVLVRWTQWNGDEATVGALAKTLKIINRGQLANELEMVESE